MGAEMMENRYDVVIIGSGPAGMTAAIYMTRGGFSTALLERGIPGGQIVNTEEIENYPGYGNINGAELAEKMFEHATSFGAKYLFGNVEKVIDHGDYKEVICGERTYEAKAVIVATGAAPSKLGAPGEAELVGKGVSYCALCDGAFFRDREVVVVGGGNAALEEAIFLAKLASKVTLIHRRDELRGAKILQDRAFANDKIEFLLSTVVREILGEDGVTGVMVEDLKTGEQRELATDGVFVYVGTEPNTDFVKDLGITDERGNIITDPNLATSVPGIFAAGDVRQKLLRQVVTATADGSIAAVSAQQYLEGTN